MIDLLSNNTHTLVCPSVINGETVYVNTIVITNTKTNNNYCLEITSVTDLDNNRVLFKTLCIHEKKNLEKLKVNTFCANFKLSFNEIKKNKDHIKVEFFPGNVLEINDFNSLITLNHNNEQIELTATCGNYQYFNKY